MDVREEQVVGAKRALNLIAQHAEWLPTNWAIDRRSRGNTKTHPRKVLVGYTPKMADLEVSSIIRFIKTKLEEAGLNGGEGVFIGRQSMFGNKNAIIIEGDISQIQLLGRRNLLGECVIVSPYKALCVTNSEANAITQALTEEPALHTALFRFRKSGPLEGQIFAQPATLVEQVKAVRHQDWVNRQPATRATLLNLQAFITLLNIKGEIFNTLPNSIMDRVGEILGAVLNEVTDQECDLREGEWRALVRDGSWTGRILLQCSVDGDLSKLFHSVHSRGVCIGGEHYTLEVSTPSNPLLSTTMFNQSSSMPSQGQGHPAPLESNTNAS